MKRDWLNYALVLVVGLALGFFLGLFIEQHQSTVFRSRVTTAPTSTKRVRPTASPSPTLEQPGTTFPTATSPYPSPTNTPPASEDNLISNGTFLNGSFAGWQNLNGYWEESIHGPISCSPSKTWYLQMDTFDPHGLIGWPPPVSEDTAWFDFFVSPGISSMRIQWEEAHHLNKGIFEVSVLGLISNDIDEEWDVLFFSSGAHSPSGTGKCGIAPPFHVDETFPIGSTYISYRVIVHGIIHTFQDAYLIGNIKVTAE